MEQDLPMACTVRIAKQAVDEHFQLGKEAKANLNKAVGIFIFYLTQAYVIKRLDVIIQISLTIRDSANEKRQSSKRQTIMYSDVMKSLTEIGFSEFTPVIEEQVKQHGKRKTTTVKDANKKAKK